MKECCERAHAHMYTDYTASGALYTGPDCLRVFNSSAPLPPPCSVFHSISFPPSYPSADIYDELL